MQLAIEEALFGYSRTLVRLKHSPPPEPPLAEPGYSRTLVRLKHPENKSANHSK